jgi:hypothetical protein
MKPLPPRIIPYRIKLATSRATTGRRLFVEGGDGRSAWGRRWRDLCLSHASDLGGPDILSEAQVSICRRASAIEVELESLEGRMSAGEPLELAQYARLTGVLCRLFELVGVKRVSKPLDPQAELVRAMAAYPATVDDDDEEPGETQ